MTVEELIAALSALPPAALVLIDVDEVEREMTPFIVTYEHGNALIALELAPGYDK